MIVPERIPGFHATLRPYQREGVEYLIRTKRSFLADAVRLGKTIQALATVHILEAYPCVIVAPAYALPVWKREISERFRGEDFLTGHFLLRSYERATKDQKALRAMNPRSVIADESHYLKNRKANRTKAFRYIAKDAYVRLLLSGTPAENEPRELVSQLAILGRSAEIAPNEWYFLKRYCSRHRFGCDRAGFCECGKNMYGYWDFSGSSFTEELNAKLRASCFLRRTRSQVQADLPEAVTEIVPLVLANRGEYDRAEGDFTKWMIETHGVEKAEKAFRAEELLKMNYLSRLASVGKFEAAVIWLTELLGDPENKAVVFTYHRETAHNLSLMLKCDRVEGGVTVERREASRVKFQTDPAVRAIVVNIESGGASIDLSAANHVVFLEHTWVPTDIEQAAGRALSLEKQTKVTTWMLLAEDTVDEDKYAVVTEKARAVKAITDGGEQARGFDDAVSETAKRLAERRKKK